MKTLAIAVAAFVGICVYGLVALYAMWMGLVFALFGQWLWVSLLGGLLVAMIYLPFYIVKKA